MYSVLTQMLVLISLGIKHSFDIWCYLDQVCTLQPVYLSGTIVTDAV